MAAAKTGKIINIKKGQFCAPSVSGILLTGSIIEIWIQEILATC